MLNATYLIYKNPDITMDTRNENDDPDYKFLKATADISMGTILAVEHLLYAENYFDNPNNLIRMNVIHNPNIFNEIYPRKVSHDYNKICDKDFLPIVDDKIYKNIFVNQIKNEDGTIKNSYSYLGIYYSKINHSKTPNVNFGDYVIRLPELKNPILIYYLIAFKDIKEGEELFINYGNAYFKENEDLSYYEKDKSNMPCFIKSKEGLKEIINNYILNSIEVRDVCLCHLINDNGLYFNYNKKEFITTERFDKLIGREATHGDAKQFFMECLIKINMIFKYLKSI